MQIKVVIESFIDLKKWVGDLKGGSVKAKNLKGPDLDLKNAILKVPTIS